MTDFLTSIGYNHWILPVLLVLPLVGAAVVLLLAHARPDARDGEAADSEWSRSGAIRWATLIVFLLEFVLSVGLWWSYDPASPNWQAAVDWSWVPAWGARFTVGVDGISLFMVLLTTFIMPLAVLGGWTSIRDRLGAYYALLLVLTTGMLGVFVSLDLLLFYVMWEVMLIPMYFIIGMWGGERRLYASIKFFVYTMLGSLLMLVAILYLWNAAGGTSFAYTHVLHAASATGGAAALWLFGAFALAFAIKVPMFPLHTWLPDAHVEAPTAGSVILAGIMLKMGTYGFLRFAMPFFPGAALHPAIRTLMIVLAVIGIIYGALVAMVQPDFKKLVAYSSVSHLGFVMLGIFALTLQSVQGALMVMINHGISTGALFLLIGMIYERRHTRALDAYGGLARVMPMFAAFLTLVSLSSIGLPSTNGFIGEFLVLIGSFRTRPIAAALATTGVIFAAAYLLWAIQRILYQPLARPENRALRDLNARETTLLVALAVMIIWIGVAPGPILRRMEGSANRFVQLVQRGTPTGPMQASTEAR
ncbi:MAG TPA: NADH-quinone oxidoreductase subunit M [Gemmatimonadaceae bacterium]|nr:NADH-quinone oxidoreductase subunit M [Gemmatimonadaceae bacterium]